MNAATVAVAVLVIVSTGGVAVDAATGPSSGAAGTATSGLEQPAPALATSVGADSTAGFAVAPDRPSLDGDDWATVGRDPARTGHNPNASGPTSGPEARWVYEFAGEVEDAPAVAADGVVYASGADSLRAVDGDTGAEFWNVTAADVDRISVSDGVAVASSGWDGSVRAFDAGTGDELWSVTDVDAEGSVALDGVFYTHRASSSNHQLRAYDLADGTELWSADVDADEGGSLGLSAAGDAVYATGTVNERDHAVYALNASDGSERWRFEVEGPIVMDPVVADGSVFVGGGDETYDPTFYRLDATDGHVEWIFDANAQPRGAAVADGFVYLASGNAVHALEESTGQRAWVHRLSASIDHGLNYEETIARPPAVADGTVYAVNHRGHLAAVDGATGDPLWRYRLDGVAARPAVADDRLYVQAIDADEDVTRVYALEDPPFEFSGFAPSKTTVDPGESFTVDVTVENVDDEAREYDLSLEAETPFPGEQWTLDRRNGTLQPGESTTLTFATDLPSAGPWTLSVVRSLEDAPAAGPVAVDVVHPDLDDTWSMGGFDASRSDGNPATDGPSRHLQEVWNVSNLEEDATPVVANGTAYVVTNRYRSGEPSVHAVAAYDVGTGAFRWEHNFTAENRIPAGSPAVVNDTVYVVATPHLFYDDVGSVDEGTVYAFDAETGATEWTTPVSIDVATTQYDHGPVVTDGRVYLAGSVYEPSGTTYTNASVVALDADDGSLTWSNSMREYRLDESYATYAVGEGYLFVTASDEVSLNEYERELRAYDAATGALVWTTDSLNLVVDQSETPVVHDGLVYAINESRYVDGEPGDELVALDVSTGAEAWRFTPENIPNYNGGDDDGWVLRKPALSGDSLYVRQSADATYDVGRLHRVDAATGEAVWNRSTAYLWRLQVVDGIVYGGESTYDPGYTRLYDAETGEALGHTDKGRSLSVANGTILAYNDWTGDLRALVEGGAIEYSDLSVDAHAVGVRENVTVTATATNVGDRPREYGANLWVTPNDDHHVYDYRTRDGHLDPGESATLTWTVELRERGDFAFVLLPNDGDDSLDRYMYERAGSATVHVGDAEDGAVVDLGGPRDLDPGTDAWPKESFDLGNTGNNDGTGAPTAVGDDTATWLANHSYAWESGPIVAEDTVYAGGYGGGDEAVYAYNATDGSLRWRYPTMGAVDVTPVYADGSLYAATNRGRVLQFDAATGDRLWTYNAEGVDGMTVADGVVYVAGSGYADSDYFGRVTALNATTREVLWTFEAGDSSYGMGITPAVVDDTVYVTSSGDGTYALDAATGEERWNRSIAGTDSRLHSPVAADGVVYVDDATYSGTDGSIYALNATDGRTIWSRPANVDGYYGSSPALANDTLFYTADGAVQAVDATGGPSGGDLLWSTSVCLAAEHSPAYADGVVFVPMEDSTVHAYDAATGNLVWRFDAYDEEAFAPAVVDGRLYATGLEYEGYTYPLLALEGGTTDQPEARFDYSGLTVSSRNVSTDDPVTVSATVENLGDAACGYAVDFAVDGSVVDTATGTVGTGTNGEETVEFTHSFSSTGTYDVSIAGLSPITVTVTEPQPDVDVSPSSWDYGTVEVDEWTYKDFEVKNLGRGDLHWNESVITGPDADEFSITTDDSTKYAYLWWGGSGYVRVDIAPKTPGPKTAELEIHSDDPDEPIVTIPLSGTVVGDPDVDVSPTSVDFGDVEVGENATANVTVSNVGGGPLAFDGAQLSGTDAGVYAVANGGGSATIAAGDSRNVTLEFAPVSTGSADATLELSTDDPDEPTVSVALSGSGTITAPNRAPVAVDDHYIVTEGEWLNVSAPGVLENDLDPDGDAVLAANHGSADDGTFESFYTSGGFNYTADPGFTGTETISYRIRDEHGEYSSYGTITIEVLPDPNTTANRAPAAVDDHYAVHAGEWLNVSAPGVLANDYDVDGDAFTATHHGSPSHGTFESFYTSGGFNYTADAWSTGTETVSYRVRDEHDEYSAYGTITIEVFPPRNRAPTAVDDHFTVRAGEWLNVSAPGVLANDYDADGDAFIATNHGSAADGTFESFYTSGGFNYTADPGFTGTETISYRIRDEHGEYSSYGTITIDVVQGNRAPSAVDDHYAVRAGEWLNVSAPGVLANDYDVDGDAFIATNHGSADNGTFESFYTSGGFNYTADPGFTGTETISYRIRDEHGKYSTYGTITIDVVDASETAPVAVDDHFTVFEGEWLNVSAPGVLANDLDPNGDAFRAVNHGSADDGTFESFYTSGGFEYRPDPGFTGTETVSYRIRDDHGEYSSYGTLTIEVLPDPNRAPTAVDDRYTVTEGEWLNVSASGVLENDYDVDGDAFLATNHGSADDGTFESFYTSGGFNYTADPGFTGTETISYRIRDEHGEYSTYGTLTIDVVPDPNASGNRRPTAVDDHFTVYEGEWLNVSAPGVLENDLDPDGDAVLAAHHGSADDGTFESFYTSGGFEYRPDPGFTGTETISYRIRDEHVEYSTYGTLTIEVLPDPNRAPTAVANDYVVLQGESLTVESPGVLANDYDVDGDAFIATHHASPSHGTLDPFYTGGGFEYTPDPGFVGVDSFTYRIRDERGAYSWYGPVTVTVVDASVTGHADVAVTPAALDFGSTPAGTTRTETLTVANVGDQNLTLSAVSVDGPGADDFEITAGNETAELGYGGTETFTVAYAPSAIGAANATVTIHSDDPDEPTVDVDLSGTGYDGDAPTVHAVDVTGSARNGSTVYANGSADIDVAVNATDAFGTISSVRVELDAQSSPARLTETATFDAASGNWTASVDVDAIAGDGRYDVTAEAIDDRGNRATVAATDVVVVDRTAPRLAATVDRVDAITGNVTVDASEPLRDGTLSVVVERPDGTNETVAVTGADDAWTGTFALPEDGQYDVTATAFDRAGNRGTGVATAHFASGDTDANDTILVKMVPSGLFVEFTTDRPVNDTFVTTTQSAEPLKPLGPDQLGVNFVNAELEKRLSGNLSHAVIGIPVDQSLLAPGTDVDDVTIRYFNETTRRWSDVPTTVENVTLPDGTTGDYWVANVTHFSTYGAVVTDATPPAVVGTNPPDGHEYADGTSSTTLRVEYDDAGSGVDSSETVVLFDGSLVTFDDATTITNRYVEYDATGLTEGSSHELEVVVYDRAGNERAETIAFSVASPPSDDESDGEPGWSGGGSGRSDTPDGPDPAADVTVTDLSVSPTAPRTDEAVTITATLENVGDADGERSVVILVDGAAIAEESVALAPGGSRTVTATHAFAEAGTYEVGVDDRAVTVEVAADDDSEVDADVPGTDDGPDGSDGDGPADGDGAEDDESDGEDETPGFGAVVALVALLSTAVLARRLADDGTRSR